MVHRVRSVKSTHIGHPDFIQYCLFYYFRFKKKQIATRGHRKSKPNWVKREIIRIKAHMPKAGCRLITAIESYGKPKAIRTDNESVFTSRLFRLGLWILGIRHQRTQIHSPWQNGRIERFFGTFKKYSDKVIFNTKKIQFALDEFQYWYNAIRPHRHLNGLTPDEQWEEINPYRKNPRQVKKVSFWNGLLTGYLLNYK
jgi:transposase InsO family protein